MKPRGRKPTPPPRPRDPRKRSVSLSAEVIAEIEAEAKRQGRSNSWIAQQAWLTAREAMRRVPAPFHRLHDSEPPPAR